jgi:hypothetical protein
MTKKTKSTKTKPVPKMTIVLTQAKLDLFFERIDRGLEDLDTAAVTFAVIRRRHVGRLSTPEMNEAVNALKSGACNLADELRRLEHEFTVAAVGLILGGDAAENLDRGRAETA